MLNERTLVLLKPDAVKRGLVGTIFQRFEQAGLKIVACKLVSATRKQLNGHFPASDEWIRGMGEKTLEVYREYNIDSVEILDTDEPFQIGLKIKEWNYHYLMLGPVMVMVLQGIHAIDTVRKLIGHTLPCKAMPGTIRGDFSINAPDLANVVGSACKNLVHASGNQAEAEQEIANWFEPIEILSWERTDEFLHFVQGEFTTAGRKISMTYAALEQTYEIPKGLKRGYGSTTLDEGFAGIIRCPATDKGKRCSAMLTFRIKSLDELRGSSGEIQKCTNPDGLDEHRVLIFMGKRDDNEFPFAQATHMTQS